jgi:hypothetical protein
VSLSLLSPTGRPPLARPVLRVVCGRRVSAWPRASRARPRRPPHSSRAGPATVETEAPACRAAQDTTRGPPVAHSRLPGRSVDNEHLDIAPRDCTAFARGPAREGEARGAARAPVPPRGDVNEAVRAALHKIRPTLLKTCADTADARRLTQEIEKALKTAGRAASTAQPTTTPFKPPADGRRWDRGTTPRSRGSWNFVTALAQLNRHIHEEPAWKVAALLAVAETGEPRWWDMICVYLQLPPQRRTHALEHARMSRAQVERLILMFILRSVTQVPVAERLLFLTAAGLGTSFNPFPPSEAPQLPGLMGLLSPRLSGLRLYPLTDSQVQAVAQPLATAACEDPALFARVRWCRAIACITRPHSCRRNPGTSGPLYVDAARRPARPSTGCCGTHQKAVRRAWVKSRATRRARRTPRRATTA